MKSFEEWTQSLTQEAKPTWYVWEDKGYGYTDNNDGFLITCCVCDRRFAISDYIGPEDFDPDNNDTFMCGDSDRCCP